MESDSASRLEMQANSPITSLVVSQFLAADHCPGCWSLGSWENEPESTGQTDRAPASVFFRCSHCRSPISGTHHRQVCAARAPLCASPAEDIPQSDPHRCRQPQSNDSVGFCGQERCRCNARLGPMRLTPILRTCFAMAGASQCAPEQAEGCRVALVQECRAWLLERKLSPSTLNLRLSSLRQLEPRRQRCTFGLDRALYSSARLGYLSPQLLYCRPSLPTSSRM